MHHARFDQMVRALGAGVSRRRVLGGLLAVAGTRLATRRAAAQEEASSGPLDCPDWTYCIYPNSPHPTILGSLDHPYGTCMSWEHFKCLPCGDTDGRVPGQLTQWCNTTYPGCHNSCYPG